MPRRRASASARVVPRAVRARVVRWRLPSQRGAIPSAVERVLAAVQPAGFGRGQRDDLAVAVAEALANAVVHGNGQSPSSQVAVTVEVEPRTAATIRIRDSGPGFDHRALPDPLDPEHLLVPRGRGIFLMKRLVDRVEYNRKGNEVRLTLRRAARRGLPAPRRR